MNATQGLEPSVPTNEWVAITIVTSIFLLLITVSCVLCWKTPGSCVHWMCVKCCVKNYDREELEELKQVI
jgi:hypothetical protein